MSNTNRYLPLSFSSLKAFSRSPLAFLTYKEEPRNETPAMRLGTMVHRAVLEPEKYEATTVVWDGTRRGNPWERFKAANADKDILTVKEALDISVMKSRLMDHPLACGLISDTAETELAFEIEQLDIPHRGIIDGLSSWCIFDLKVTQRVDHHSLQRTIWDFKYHMQAAIYQRAAVLHGYKPEAYFIIAVESSAPYHVNVVELEPHYIARGHLEWEKLLKQFKEWDGTAAHEHDEGPAKMMDAPAWVPSLDLEFDEY